MAGDVLLKTLTNTKGSYKGMPEPAALIGYLPLYLWEWRFSPQQGQDTRTAPGGTRAQHKRARLAADQGIMQKVT